MIGIFLCILAFGLTNAMTRRSLGAGLVALMTVGYAYGLIRARVPDGGTHFIFDAALMGLYARAFSGLISAEMRLRTETATWWTLGLMAWPIICMFYAPLVTDDAQPLIIQLVGLRGAVLMLPCLVLGARLKRARLRHPGAGARSPEPRRPRLRAPRVLLRHRDIHSSQCRERHHLRVYGHHELWRGFPPDPVHIPLFTRIRRNDDPQRRVHRPRPRDGGPCPAALLGRPRCSDPRGVHVWLSSPRRRS